MERSYADASFDELSILDTDPLVESIKQKATEFATLISDTPECTDEEKIELMRELDQSWPFMHREISITGNVKLKSVETGEVEHVYVEDAAIVSTGFCFVEEKVEIEGEAVGSRYLPAFHITEMLDNGYRCGVALFDQVMIEYPAESSELIENRLRHFHFDAMEDFDVRIMNADNEDEGTLALADIVLTIDSTVAEDVQFLSDAQRYLTQMLDYDAELPYFIEIADEFFIEEEDGVKLVDPGSYLSGYFQPQKIQFLPKHPREMDEDDSVIEFAPSVSGLYYSQDRKLEPTSVYLPIAQLGVFMSVRRS